MKKKRDRKRGFDVSLIGSSKKRIKGFWRINVSSYKISFVIFV